jgi:putative peptidoglycan lipid II flippase
VIGTVYDTSVGRGLLTASVTVGIFSLVGKLLGVIQQAVVAAKFGTGRELDAYLVGSSLANFVTNVLILGTLSSVFVSAYALARRKGGQAGGWSFASAMLTVSVCSAAVAALALVVVAPYVMLKLAPGFSPDSQREAVMVARLLSPLLILMAASTVFGGVLYAHQRFAVPLLAFNVTAVLLIASVLFLSSKFGIYSFAIGLVGGSAISLALFAPALRAIRFRLNFAIAGMVVVATAADLTRFIARAYASNLPAGSVATFEYGLLFERIIVGLFAVAIATAAYPLLANAASTPEDPRFFDVFRTAIRYVAVTTLPLTGLALIVRRDLVHVWLERGSFHAAQTDAVSALFVCLSAALVAWAFAQVIVYAYLAMNRVLPIVVGVTSSTLIASLLFGPLVHLFGLNGIAISISIAATLSTSLMWMYLESRSARGISLSRRLAFVGQLGLATLTAMAACYAVVAALASLPLSGGISTALLHILVGAAAGILVFGLVAHALGIKEVQSIAGRTFSFLRLRARP